MPKSSVARSVVKRSAVKAPPVVMDRLDALRNLGPESVRMLEAVGVTTRAALNELGAVGAYVAVKRSGQKPTLNLLYALEGALRDIAWTDLPYQVKASLTLEADAYLAAEGMQ